MSVCHILPALPAHGAEQLLLDIAKNTNREKVRLTVCLISELGPLVKDFEVLGIPVIIIPKKSRYDFSIVWRLALFFKKNRFDIIHTHLFTADLWTRLAALFLQMGVVSTFHTTSDPKVGRVGKWLNWILTFRNDAVICVSEAVRTYQIEKAGIHKNKLIVIENGIDLGRFNNLPSRESIRQRLAFDNNLMGIVIVGRLIPLKGHRYLIEALAQLQESYPLLRIVIVGEGECEDALKKQASELGLIHRVLFLGLRRDVPEILKAMDLLAIPSSREGLPIVLLEAMAAGVPVIATKVGGIPEVLREGETGLFVEPNSKSIAKTLKKILADPELRRKLGEKAKITAEARYDIRIVAKRYEDLYQSILSKRIRPIH